MTAAGWNSIFGERPHTTADLEIAIIDREGTVVALVEPARWTGSGWTSADTGRLLDLDPTHWRPWPWSDRLHP